MTGEDEATEQQHRLVMAMMETEGTGLHPSYNQMLRYAKAAELQLLADMALKTLKEIVHGERS